VISVGSLLGNLSTELEITAILLGHHFTSANTIAESDEDKAKLFSDRLAAQCRPSTSSTVDNAPLVINLISAGTTNFLELSNTDEIKLIIKLIPKRTGPNLTVSLADAKTVA
jgi:hypothetical protein